MFSVFLAAFWALKVNLKVSGYLCWNHLLIIKILPVTLFKELVEAYRKPQLLLKIFRKPTVILKTGLKAAYDMYTWENRPLRMRGKEYRNRNIIQNKKCTCTNEWFLFVQTALIQFIRTTPNNIHLTTQSLERGLFYHT